jgi:hypothetical protein
MTFDFKGNYNPNSRILDFIKFLENINGNSIWNYQGLKVEIDPTIDTEQNNVLIRWTDIEEGFNDRIIFSNLDQFIKNFQLIYA